MPSVITVNRPDVIVLIEQAASKLTGGNKTEAIALAMRCLLEQDARIGSLFGAHPGSVRVKKGINLIDPIFEDGLDAEIGRESSGER